MADSQRKTANLFDWSTIAAGYRITWSTGALLPDSTAIMSDYIAVEKKVYRTNASYNLVAYDSDKNYLGVYNPNEINLKKDYCSKTTYFDLRYLDVAYIKLMSYSNTDSITYTTMFNEGSQQLPYEPYGWLHSLRKLTTVTEAVENPLYSDGSPITAYTLKGNEEHTGTPSPQNPVMPNGVGERTENLWSDVLEQGTISSSTGVPSAADNRVRGKNGIRLASGTYTIATDSGKMLSARIYNLDGTYNRSGGVSGNPVSITLESEFLVKFIIQYTNDSNISPSDVSQIMLNAGSTAKPYEHYGYKIPISSGGVTTNIYLGSTQTLRQIKNLVLTGQENNWSYSNLGADTALFSLPITANRTQLEICTHFTYNVISTSNTVVGFSVIASGTELRIRPDNASTYTLETWKQWLATQYANGTPVTIWYVLATPETATVNEPLMKIGDYADTLSNAVSIPTTEGANSITVDTTVQPSEFTATWTGWHDSSVKEWDGSQWNE